MNDQGKFRDQLLELMQQQYQLYQDIFELSETKTKALIKTNIKEIEQVSAQIVEKLQIGIDLENQRQQIISQLAKQINIDEKELTLSFLIKYFNDDKLANVKQEFNSLLKRLQTVNERNAMLAQNAQETYSKLRDILYSYLDQSIGYNDKGKTTDSQAGGYFEEQA